MNYISHSGTLVYAFEVLFHHTFTELVPVFFLCSSFRSLSTQHMCRLSSTSTHRRKESFVSSAANSSRSWIILTPTGGKEAATARLACSPATTSSPSVGTCKPVQPCVHNENGRPWPPQQPPPPSPFSSLLFLISSAHPYTNLPLAT